MRASLTKHITAHTLRHTAATWLRQATGDSRLVAEYLGHADLSTDARYAHVASEERHAAARTAAGGPLRAPAPSDSIEIASEQPATPIMTRTRRLDP